MSQPTGGVILLNDTQPDEEKTLLKLEVKKAVTQPAPGGNAVGATATPATPVPAAANSASDAGSLATILTLAAVDEDDEDGEEAPVPGEFEYEPEDDEEQ